MWKRCYGFVCALVMLVISSGFDTFGQTSDPSLLPRIQLADLSYVGAFRLPRGFANGDSFMLGGSPVTFNPSRNSLFVGNHRGNVAEVAIPAAPLNSSDVNQLPFATFLQAFYEPTEGTLAQITGSPAAISGLLAMGDRVYGTASIFYDSLNVQRVSHYARSSTLSVKSTVGMRQVWLDERAGFVSGFMATVPAEWQQKLGGPAVTGQCCIPIAYRTSWGPSAFAFNPADIYTQTKVPATPLLYYSMDHPTLGIWQDNDPVYSASAEVGGVALLAGTRTALYFGRIGTGEFCYGTGTSNQSLHGTPTPDGTIYCYDPTSTAKGQHGYPYHYQIWAYDLNDLAAVKAGLKKPWDVRPYGVWPFGLPFGAASIRIGGIGYDPSRQLLYISQMYADVDRYEHRAVIHVLKVGGGAAGAPLPPPSTTPLPPVTVTGGATTEGNRLTALALTSNKPAPQPAGTAITFSATPTGGTAPHQYKWLVHNGEQWSVAAGWSTASTFTWTPAAANSQARVGVWVRSDGNSNDAAEFTNSVDFPVTNSTSWTPPYEPTIGVTISADKPEPQPAGSTITWTATPSRGLAPHEYKWLVHNGLQWTEATGWTTSNRFVWTPAIANAGYRIGVWVRSAGGTAASGEATASADFAINGTSTATPAPAPAPTTGGRLTGVSLTANKAAPQPAGTTITLSATPAGGIAPHQYKFLVHNGLSWSAVTGWSTVNTFNWTPTSSNASYRIGVWVKDAGVSGDTPQVTHSIDFAISGGTAPAPAPAPAPTTTTGRLTGVTLAANKIAPQPVGSAITFSATPAGGTAPHQYKFLLHDGFKWTAKTEWSTANTFTWTPTYANSSYRVGVWVKNAGVAGDSPEVTHSIDFAISAGAAPPPPPPTTTTTTTRLTTVVLGANKIAPQPVGGTITFAATPTGGAAPHQYKFLVHNGLSWSAVTGWSTTNTFNWTPTVANSSYRIGVWVKSAGVSGDSPEVTTSIDFPIGAATVTPTPTTTTSTTTYSRVTALRLSANLPAPQTAGTLITFTAVPTGGTGPHQYKWLVHNGTAWTAVTGWSTANTFNWVPPAANSRYRIGVWVRSAGRTADIAEQTMSMDFPIK